MEISRLHITGAINTTTPQCVLEEIIDAHHLVPPPGDLSNTSDAYDLTRTITTSSQKIIIENDLHALRVLARFINHNSIWQKKNLIAAYKFLAAFYNKNLSIHKALNIIESFPIKFIDEKTDIFDHINFDKYVGLQSNDNIYTLNACILYKICIDNNILVNYRTTLETLKYEVKMLIYHAKSFAPVGGKNNPVNTSVSTPSSSVSTVPSTALATVLFSTYQKLRDSAFIQKRLVPQNREEALAMAALFYKFDLSISTEPIADYLILSTVSPKIFRCPLLQKWYNRNRDLFNLEITFNPAFPLQYYTYDNLHYMKTFATADSGISAVGGSDGGNTAAAGSGVHGNSSVTHVYNFLVNRAATDTFYFGDHYALRERQTVIMREDLDDLPNNRIILYGSPQKELRATTIDELLEIFKKYKNFINIFDINKVFSNDNIHKLKNILFTLLSGKIDPIVLDLKNYIEYLENFTQDEDIINALRFLHQRSPSTVENIFHKLLHLTMFLRGWDGMSGEYPIERAESAPEFANQIEVNVINAINDFYKSITQLNFDDSVLILSLPVVKWMDNKYVKSITIKNDTIGERIHLIKEGQDGDDASSCIRVNSNYLGASYHKYMVALNLRPAFAIEKLRYIS